ncbi:DNA-formamidopyrimidine glycosylase [Oceanobacillus sp. CAU 1775]
MPELPEVETIRRTLEHLILEKEIKDVEVFWGKIIKEPDDTEKFKHLLIGQTIRALKRRGKFLLFYLDDYVLVSHLRMEGKYSVHPNGDEIKKHTHVIFTFTDGEELRYNDVRKFGTMHVYPIGKEMQTNPLKTLGPEPFDTAFSFNYFKERLKKTERLIKAVLLDQTVVTGLGNIYVDETLFKAGVHPLRRANTLNDSEIQAIQEAAVLTLTEAVELGGTTIRSYVNSAGDMGMFQQELFVYGQQEKPCKNCGGSITKMKVAGRGTHICESCQPF